MTRATCRRVLRRRSQSINAAIISPETANPSPLSPVGPSPPMQRVRPPPPIVPRPPFPRPVLHTKLSTLNDYRSL